MGLFDGEPTVYFNRIEYLWRSGSWCRPGEWVWGYTAHDDGCREFHLGWINVFFWPRKGHHASNSGRWENE